MCRVHVVCIHVHTTRSVSFKEDAMPGHLFHLIKPLEKIRGVFSCGEISSTGNGFQKHLGNVHNTLSLNAAVCIFFITDKNDKVETACLKAPISYISCKFLLMALFRYINIWRT